MRIGITYDLRQDYLDEGFSQEQAAEFDKPETIEGIEQALRELGHLPERVGRAKELVRRLAEGARWDLVFNIAEGLWGYGRESLVPCLLEAYEIPYTFSDPLTLAASLHKGVCKRLVQAAGVPTADFEVVEHAAGLADVGLTYPRFVNPVAEGTGKDISEASVIRHWSQLVTVGTDLLARFGQPVLVETYLPGREFTVGILGTGAASHTVGTMEVLPHAAGELVYSYETKENYLDLVRYELCPDSPLLREVERVALRAWQALGCRDGGRVDVRLDAQGAPMFVEVNPLAGLNPVHSDLPIIARLAGWSFTQLIGSILESATQRSDHARRRAA